MVPRSQGGGVLLPCTGGGEGARPGEASCGLPLCRPPVAQTGTAAASAAPVAMCWSGSIHSGRSRAPHRHDAVVRAAPGGGRVAARTREVVHRCPAALAALRRTAARTKDWSVADLEPLSSWHLRALAKAPSLRVHPGDWSLPQCATHEFATSALQQEWGAWSCGVGLPHRAEAAGAAVWRHSLARHSWPVFGPDAMQFESAMRATIDDGAHMVAPDDKRRRRSWTVRGRELWALLLSLLLADRSWCLTSLLLRDLAAQALAVSTVALPARLRGPVQAAEVRGPYGYPTVKEKCFRPDGGRRCSQPGHSCLRKVISTVGLPWRAAWKFVGRALQALVVLTGGSDEVWALKDAADAARAADRRSAAGAGPPQRCCSQCGAPRESAVTLAVLDAAQVFEACEAGAVLAAGRAWAGAFSEGGTCDVYVTPRGPWRAWRDKPGRRVGAVRRRSAEEVVTGLRGACMLNLVSFGRNVWRMAGMAIGGWAERSSPLPAGSAAARYVDDVLGISRTLCQACFEAVLKARYPVSLERTGAGKRVVWLDLEIVSVQSDAFDAAVLVRYCRKNRMWVCGGAKRNVSRLPAFVPGISDVFSKVRSQFSGVLSRALQVSPSDPQVMAALLELVVEAFIDGYPPHLLQRVLFSLPRARSVGVVWAAAQVGRWCVAMPPRKGVYRRESHRAQATQADGGREQGRGSRRAFGRAAARRRSPSSSSSTSSVGYREYKAAKATEAQEQSMRRQAEVIVASIRSAWRADDAGGCAAALATAMGVHPTLQPSAPPAATPCPDGFGRSPFPVVLPRFALGRPVWRCVGCGVAWDGGVAACESPLCPLGAGAAHAVAGGTGGGSHHPVAQVAAEHAGAGAAQSGSGGSQGRTGPNAPSATAVQVLEAALGWKLPDGKLAEAAAQGEPAVMALLRELPSKDLAGLSGFVQRVGGQKPQAGGKRIAQAAAVLMRRA